MLAAYQGTRAKDRAMSSGSDDTEGESWVQWFCSLKGNEFFCEVMPAVVTWCGGVISGHGNDARRERHGAGISCGATAVAINAINAILGDVTAHLPQACAALKSLLRYDHSSVLVHLINRKSHLPIATHH